MASGNGTKIHRRLPSGEDLQTTLLAIILGPSWRNLATGDVGLTSQPRLRGSGSSFFGQEPPPPVLLPPLSRRHSEVLRQTLPSTRPCITTPGSRRQRPLLANIARRDQRPRNVVMMNGSSLHLYLGSPGTSHSRLLPVPLGSGGPLWLAAVGCTLDADPCHSLGLWVLQMPA